MKEAAQGTKIVIEAIGGRSAVPYFAGIPRIFQFEQAGAMPLETSDSNHFEEVAATPLNRPGLVITLIISSLLTRPG